MERLVVLFLAFTPATAMSGRYLEIDYGLHWVVKAHKSIELDGAGGRRPLESASFCIHDESCSGFVQHSNSVYLLDLDSKINHTLQADDFGLGKIFVDIGS